MAISETQLIEGIKKEINDPLAVLVTKLKNRAAVQDISCARENFEYAIAESVVAAIKDAINEGIE